MKKILSIISLLIVILTLISCSDKNDEEIVQPTEEAVERGPVNYTVYVDYALGSQPDLEIEESSKVTMKPIAEKDFYFVGTENIERPENAADTINLTIHNKTYEFSYRDSQKFFSASETSKFKDRAIVNRYCNDTRDVELLEGSNKPVFFFTDVSERVKEGNFTEEEAVEAAKAVIAELYGADAIEEYSLRQFADNGESKEKYSIGFGKKIFGYETNDHITVNFDMAGNLVSLNAYKLGIMQGAEKDLTQEEIEKAIAYVEDTFSDNWNVSIHSVVVDTEGDYYIEVGISRKVGDMIQAIQIHVNIR